MLIYLNAKFIIIINLLKKMIKKEIIHFNIK